MGRPWFFRLSAVAVAAGCGLFLMSRFGALQIPSVLTYSGLAVCLCGLLASVLPPRWIGFSRRYHAPVAGLLVGAALFAAGRYWPPGSFHTPSPATRLDAFLPEYNFQERHEIVIDAPADRVRAALDEVTWSDVRVMQTLGRIRSVAMGRMPAGGGLSPVRILDSMKSPKSGFFTLADTPEEYVFGLAGQPWNNAAVRLTAAEFRGWEKPGSIKVAANFLVQSEGAGRSRVITETRVAACDSASREKMAQYWALIYPGSGMIRQSLLEAVRVRAEAR